MKAKNIKDGDQRKVTKFAWLPVVVGDRKIWLEGYDSVQTLRVTPHGCNDCYSTLTPCNGDAFDYQWEEVSKMRRSK